ncbi:MAG: NAD(P)H-dependent oxidoreductase [Candidatus Taylorbacteria bacterium]
MTKKVLVFLGHPNNEKTLCGSFADAYEEGARKAGYEVKRINLGDLKFDPILHKGYKVIQELEPDLKMAQEAWKWADHIALFYPNWFITMPALLKGFFDRVWLPGFAYHFLPGRYSGWQRLLKGRSADVIITMDANPFIERLLFGDFSNEIKNGIMGFAGISPVRVTKVGPMKGINDERHKIWQAKMKKLGSRC